MNVNSAIKLLEKQRQKLITNKKNGRLNSKHPKLLKNLQEFFKTKNCQEFAIKKQIQEKIQRIVAYNNGDRSDSPQTIINFRRDVKSFCKKIKKLKYPSPLLIKIHHSYKTRILGNIKRKSGPKLNPEKLW